MTEQKAIDEAGSVENYIQKICSVDENTAAEMKDAVYSFTYQWDYEIRQVQMGNYDVESKHGHKMEDVIRKAEMVEQYIKTAPKWQGTTYRGIAVDLNTFLDTENNGETIIDMLGTSSWSTSLQTAKTFAQNARQKDYMKAYMIIYTCTSPQQGTSVQYLSKIPEEQEILCSKENKYRIKSTKRGTDGFFYVDVEMVNQ